MAKQGISDIMWKKEIKPSLNEENLRVYREVKSLLIKRKSSPKTEKGLIRRLRQIFYYLHKNEIDIINQEKFKDILCAFTEGHERQVLYYVLLTKGYITDNAKKWEDRKIHQMSKEQWQRCKFLYEVLDYLEQKRDEIADAKERRIANSRLSLLGKYINYVIAEGVPFDEILSKETASGFNNKYGGREASRAVRLLVSGYAEYSIKQRVSCLSGPAHFSR